MRRLLLLLLVATPAFAKSLSWDGLNVTAHLNRSGALDVVERQTFVFDGDWNGGERSFRLREHQSLDFHGITRIAADGREVPLQRGDLSAVDRYDFTSGDVVRWRSRLPSDPPFNNDRIVYTLNYTLHNVLQKRAGNDYRLDHDFAFPNRPGEIRSFTLDLTFDPEWNMEPVHITGANLQAGASEVVTRDLKFTGSGEPEATVPMWLSFDPFPLVAIAAGMLVIGFLFFQAERATGRLSPPLDPSKIDESWLRAHLMSMKPEVVGAAWDAKIGAAEVAAVLARLTAEGKLTSRVAGSVLHLHLNQPLSAFAGYEKELLGKLFFDGNDTDTERVKSHYESSGFDPVAMIRKGVEAQVDGLPAFGARVKRFNAWWILVLLAIAAFAFFMGGPGAVPPTMTVLLFTLIASVVAAANSPALTGVPSRFFWTTFSFLPAFAAGTFWTAFSRHFGLATPAAVAVGVLVLVAWKIVVDAFKIRDSVEYIAFRKDLVAARRYFVEQLGSSQPQLRDEWLPYLLAFGLGSNVDRWFRSFGGATADTSSSTWSSSSSSSSSSGSSSGWTGGGGAFGGAGATGAWAAAAGTLAAGVAAPSSSDSGGGGGGGGGGGSSGGGGGGGW